jgi:hypothetical protein
MMCKDAGGEGFADRHGAIQTRNRAWTEIPCWPHDPAYSHRGLNSKSQECGDYFAGTRVGGISTPVTLMLALTPAS